MSTQQHKDEKIQPPYADEHEESFLIEVSSSLPTLSSIQSFLTHPTCGAISLFCGTTRNNFNGKIVTSLSYEGYIPMATKELTKLCLEAKETFGVEKIVSVHIVGECPVGDVSVIVGSCGAHRRETIRCTEFLIDELKARKFTREMKVSGKKMLSGTKEDGEGSCAKKKEHDKNTSIEFFHVNVLNSNNFESKAMYCYGSIAAA
ncbi:hypothetical protein HJC23_006456 [Cyclotella cryptica]|uniref:Uncharacterized protein n=1 Tax=Cyclotella cryptica TaxID=29204 RepID=A0ABD3QUX4_9STRA